MTEDFFWELATSLSKLLLLLSIAGVIGGNFSLYLANTMGFPTQPQLLRYLLASAVLGMFSMLLFFLVQAGAINQNGIAGMLDYKMVLILAKSSLGYAAGLRVIGFVSVIPAVYLFRSHGEIANSARHYGKAGFLVLVTVTALLCLSFALTGHISTLPIIARVGIVLHVLGICLWVGALYPLLHLSNATDVSKVKKLMQRFGSLALLIVAVLAASGAFLLTRLLPSFNDLFFTQYGITVLVKLTGVLALLALAGRNKLLLVPRITRKNAILFLQSSIRTEIVIALFILMVTAWLTTAVGPAN